MVVMLLLNKVGLGQVLAPVVDEASMDRREPDPLPSPAVETLQTPTAAAMNSPVPSTPGRPLMIQCEHCHQMTPLKTPSHAAPHGCASDSIDPALKSLLCDTSLETAFMNSPQFREKDPVKKLFNMFRHAKPEQFQDRHAENLRAFITKYPHLLTVSRVVPYASLGVAVADGFTPLMAAAQANYLRACQIMIEYDKEIATTMLQQVNFAGQTALHIAAAAGHAELFTYLVSKMKELGLPLDLPDVLGRTPLGAGLTSPAAKKSRNYQSYLLKELPASNDPSIVGTPAPMTERTIMVDSLSAVMVHAEMPGIRVDMEDALITYADDDKIIAAVCDGHDDGGHVSKFVSTNLLDELQELNPTVDWTNVLTDAFYSVDSKLRESEIKGGSTCVAAVVTKDKVVVANAGDSRAILIHSVEHEDDITEQLTKLSISDSATKSSKSFVAKPMSIDHKPDLPLEQERINKAGLEVIDDHGFPKVVYKTDLDKSSLGMSRSFGDFEFKSTELAPADQAVTVTPEIMIHERSSADQFLVLACDGVFDVMTNEQVASFVMNQVEAGVAAGDTFALTKTADGLLQESLRLETKDNMSVVIVALRDITAKPEHAAIKTRLAYD